MRDTFHRRRQRGEERKWKLTDGIAKFRTVRSVPGMDGVERFQLREAGPFHYSHQIQASVGKSPGAIRETNQRQHRARRPDFGVRCSGGFESRK
jgi:hypothetical protein